MRYALALILLACSSPSPEVPASTDEEDIAKLAACKWEKLTPQTRLQKECGLPCETYWSPDFPGVDVFVWCVQGCSSECYETKMALIWDGYLQRIHDGRRRKR